MTTASKPPLLGKQRLARPTWGGRGESRFAAAGLPAYDNPHGGRPLLSGAAAGYKEYGFEQEGRSMSLPRGMAGLGLAIVLVLPALQAQDKTAEKKAPATLIVKVPEEAVVIIEDKETRKKGTVRKFDSPPLEPGKRYQYKIVAKIEPNNYTKIIRTRIVKGIEAGKEVEVDMTKNDPREPDEIKIRYVPTPQEVVDAMLKMGKAKKDDIVFDLGCGDGRIVCTAVAKFGAKKGIGVDIDPERIEDSHKTAKEMKVEDKVEFRKEDVLKLKDISDATLVCLYMGNEMNMALRPILWKSLKPGTRIVSHRFIMGDWKPEKSETITVDGTEYKLHMWTITDKEKEKVKGPEKGKE
jgi:uncharacterized protein (TIGR03000 family)